MRRCPGGEGTTDPPSRAGAAPSLLVVDEELVVSTLGPELARRMPAVVSTATRLQDAWSLLERGSFDLVLVAQAVAGENSAPFVREAKARGLRVVLLSPAPPAVTEAVGVILKPYNLRWVTRAAWAFLAGAKPPRQQRPVRGWRSVSRAAQPAPPPPRGHEIFK